MSNILFNKLLTGQLQIFTAPSKKDNTRTIQNKTKQTRDKKTKQCTRYRSHINFINNLIDKNKREVENA